MTRTERRGLKQAPALVASVVALFVALSGAAVALPGKDTVNSGDIKNETVKSVDLKDGKAVKGVDVVDETLTGTDVADESLTGTDVADESLGASDLGPNSVGPSELAPGSLTAKALGDGIKIRVGTANVPGGTAHNAVYNFNTATASCLPGEELIGGNGFWQGDGLNDETVIAEVTPNHNGESVTVRGGNDSGTNATLVAYAECL